MRLGVEATGVVANGVGDGPEGRKARSASAMGSSLSRSRALARGEQRTLTRPPLDRHPPAMGGHGSPWVTSHATPCLPYTTSDQSRARLTAGRITHLSTARVPRRIRFILRSYRAGRRQNRSSKRGCHGYARNDKRQSKRGWEREPAVATTTPADRAAINAGREARGDRRTFSLIPSIRGARGTDRFGRSREVHVVNHEIYGGADARPARADRGDRRSGRRGP